MEGEIQFPESGTVREVQDWIRRWNELVACEHVVLVIGPRSFATPIAVVVLASAVAERQAMNRKTSVRYSADSDTFRYLQRMDVFRGLGIDLPEEFKRHDAGGRFVPLTRIETLRIAQETAERTRECLRTQVTLPPTIERAAAYIFEELGANIVQHSGAPRTGFGMTQAWPGKSRLQIAFADRGVGFLASMQRHAELEGRLSDEGEALQLALEKGITSGGQYNIGMGLAWLRSFSDQLRAELWIGSGSALLHRRSVGASRSQTVTPAQDWRGAWICLEASIPSTIPEG